MPLGSQGVHRVHNLEATAAHYVVESYFAPAIDLGSSRASPVHASSEQSSSQPTRRDGVVHGQERAANVSADGGIAGADLGRAALDDFVKSERPVRWWHVSMPSGRTTTALRSKCRRIELALSVLSAAGHVWKVRPHPHGTIDVLFD
jgi:hypothetical protein